MIADRILPLLDKVKKKSDNSWMACCPAHDDKTPSLVITEKEGVVLLQVLLQTGISFSLSAYHLQP